MKYISLHRLLAQECCLAFQRRAGLQILAGSMVLWAGASPALAQAPYPRTGWVANLSTLSHNVSGMVTIIDANTYQVSNFTYDAGGISVFFYLAAMNTNASFQPTGGGLSTGPQLRGGPVYTESNPGNLTIDLPAGTNFDGRNAISVWCVAANSSFGDGTFISPLENWRRVAFGNTANTGNGADTFDFDQDGHSNLMEYATRTDPKVPNTGPFPTPTQVTLPGNVKAQQFVFPYRVGVLDVRYRVLRSTDLSNWTEIYRNEPKTATITSATGVTSVENPLSQTITITDATAGNKFFWRLAVEPTPL